MYALVLLLHSWLRWLALGAGVAATLAAFGKGAEAVRSAERWGLIFMIALDVQLLLGLLLYGVLSPFTTQAMQDFGGAMNNSAMRFWAVEHIFGMIVAIALTHIGRARVRRITQDTRKHKVAAIFFTLALLTMLASIPWPGTAAGRPLLRW